MSVITGVVVARFDNKQTKNGPRQLVEVQLPGHAEKISVWGKPGELDAFYVNGQINVEQKGQYWNLAQNQPGNGTPPQAPANGAGYTPHGYDHEAMKERARQLAELYLQIARQVRADDTFAMETGQVIASAAATIFIQLRP